MEPKEIEQQILSDITLFAETNFRNQKRSFGIKRDDRRRHMYIIGKTGMGKTVLLENMVISDILKGDGCCYIDPHGDTAERLLDFIPADRINDVIYFNPADASSPIAFNILESVDDDKKHLVVSGMMGVFKKIWPDVWSSRMEYILNNTLLALLDYPGSTMLGINRMMSDKPYRLKIYEKIKDPVVKGFWINEFEAWEDRFRKEAVAAIQNKVGQFLSNSMVRNIIGQVKSTIDLRDVIDNKKILIMNLSKGRIGEDAMNLLGGMMVTKIYLEAMGRVDIPENERKDFYLYVDEFQNFASESFADILSEARKYRLNLTMAHQYIEQLSEEVAAAVFGNVGTLVSFRVGAGDAEILVKEFTPTFLEEDLVSLPAFNIYLKLMIDGVASDPFSASTLPPMYDEYETNNADKVIKVSRERYANPKNTIEDKINRWSGLMAEEKPPIVLAGKSGLVSKSNQAVVKPEFKTKQEKKASYIIEPKPAEQKYIVECFDCGKSTEINFFPDGKRPVFCKECLAKSRKEKEKLISKIATVNQAKVISKPIESIPKLTTEKDDDNDYVSLADLKERR